MKLEDAYPFQGVTYIPTHANGDRNHPDCEFGRVKSKNDKVIFVLFGRGDTAQACRPQDLVPG